MTEQSNKHFMDNPDLAVISSIIVRVSGQTVQIDENDLEVIENDGITYFYYRSDDGDLFIPIK